MVENQERERDVAIRFGIKATNKILISYWDNRVTHFGFNFFFFSLFFE